VCHSKSPSVLRGNAESNRAFPLRWRRRPAWAGDSGGSSDVHVRPSADDQIGGALHRCDVYRHRWIDCTPNARGEPSTIRIGLGADDVTFVFGGVEESEVYGAQPMTFDWPDLTESPKHHDYQHYDHNVTDHCANRINRSDHASGSSAKHHHRHFAAGHDRAAGVHYDFLAPPTG
jgi:hypothetical protein